MKNKRSRNFNDMNRYPENDRYRQENDNYYDQNQNFNYDRNDQDYNRSNYNDPMSNRDMYDTYNESQYKKDKNRNWEDRSSNSGRSYQDNLRNQNSGNYSNQNYQDKYYDNNSSEWNESNNNRRSNYGHNNPQDRGWWDKTRDEVSSWFGDTDAERRRKMDEAREDSHHGKGPKNYTRSQERIKEDVNDKLSDDWMVDASDIEVEVSGSEVTLKGSVKSKQAKRRAEDCADAVSGVTHVQNNLRVNSNADINTTDASTGKAKTTATTDYSARSRKETMNHN